MADFVLGGDGDWRIGERDGRVDVFESGTFEGSKDYAFGGDEAQHQLLGNVHAGAGRRAAA
jgi:hypothetical protein